MTAFLDIGFFELAHFSNLGFAPGFNTIISRKVFFKVGGFAEKVVHAEDFDLSKRLIKAGFQLRLLREPKLIFSLRRLRREGTLQVLRKYSQAAFHVLFKGPITKAIFEYEMGGHMYDKGKHRKDVLENVRERLKKQKNRISSLVEEIERLILYEEEHPLSDRS